jgi:hypothetical protein
MSDINDYSGSETVKSLWIRINVNKFKLFGFFYFKDLKYSFFFIEIQSLPKSLLGPNKFSIE